MLSKVASRTRLHFLGVNPADYVVFIRLEWSKVFDEKDLNDA